jgi:hypothetical protein
MKSGIRAVQAISTMLPKMRYKNLGNSSVEVEVVSDEVEIRIGETKWTGVVYVREGKSKLYVRTKAEFKAKFVPVSDAKP